MSITLWEAAADVEALLLDDEMQEAALEIAIPVFKERCAAVLAVTDKFTAAVDYYKAEEKRIADRRKAIENRVKRIKEYLQSGMEVAGLMELELGTKKLSIQKNPPKVVIDDEDLVPQQFKTIVQSVTIQKAEIKEALKSGDVPGCHTEQGLSLRIK